MKLVPMAQEFQRVRKTGARPPLRTFTEMADEFGVPTNSLSALLGHTNGPKPELKKFGMVSNKWYEPVAMRKWWSELPPDVRAHAQRHLSIKKAPKSKGEA